MKLFSENLNFAISITFNKKKAPIGVDSESPSLSTASQAERRGQTYLHYAEAQQQKRRFIGVKEGFGVVVKSNCGTAASSRSTAPVNSCDRTAPVKAQKRSTPQRIGLISPSSQGGVWGGCQKQLRHSRLFKSKAHLLVGESERIACCMKIVSPPFQRGI